MKIPVKTISRPSRGIVKTVDDVRFTNLGARLVRVRRVYFV